MRLDVYLAANGAKSREAARTLIKKGLVRVNGEVVTKPAYDTDGSGVVFDDDLRYVSRGGLKLERAIEEFGIDLAGLTCLDIGASTGGFTDCMLQHGAGYVYAVDVGHGQLDASLASDERVCSMEGTNLRDLTRDMFARPIDMIGTDVSFISLRFCLPVAAQLLDAGKTAVMLVKPQFECGRENLGKNGIVRDASVGRRVLEEICAFAEQTGFSVIGTAVSPVKGGGKGNTEGNTEYLMYIRKERDTDENSHTS